MPLFSLTVTRAMLWFLPESDMTGLLTTACGEAIEQDVGRVGLATGTMPTTAVMNPDGDKTAQRVAGDDDRPGRQPWRRTALPLAARTAEAATSDQRFGFALTFPFPAEEFVRRRGQLTRRSRGCGTLLVRKQNLESPGYQQVSADTSWSRRH